MSTAHDSPDSAEISLPQDDLATRKTLGQYELKKKLGQGGMGAVYLAVDSQLKRQVALKILPREKASNPQLVKRFKAEAQNASQLTHENIVAVYGAGEADGYLYIALEFVDGIDVHDLVERRGVLPVKRSIDIIKQVCRALQHALDQGIVHRDIKPANLLIRRDGVVKLADMGLARAVDETTETGLTRAGTTVGTVDYMSPEQARNSKAADVRSDIYSLGCTWYHMLTGTPPYAEGSLTNKLNAHANRPPPDARDKNPAVPEGVVAVMQRMMAKTPNERYQTPGELIKDLEGALVNRDAVSRKILEAIDDESGYRDAAANDSRSGDQDESGSRPVNLPLSDADVRVPPATEVEVAEDPYATSKLPVQPEKPTGAVDSTYEVSAPVTQPHPTRPAASTSAGSSVPSPTVSASSPSTSRGKGNSPTPVSNKTVTASDSSPDALPSQRSPSANKPVAATAKSTPASKPTASAAKSVASAGKSVTGAGRSMPASLPPPKRKGQDDQAATVAAPMSSQMKNALTALGIVVGLGVIVFLASLAQQLGGAVETAPVVNPFEAPLPPPPLPAAGAEAPNAGAEAVATVDGDQPKVKDILVERNEVLAAAGSAPAASSTKSTVAGLPSGIDSSKFVPDWVDAELSGLNGPMMSVRKGSSVPGERLFATLAEAVQALPATGGRIVLFHDGPFELRPVDMHGGALLIEAAQGVRPQIRLVADGEHRKLPWLNVTNGTLVLDGVDLVGESTAVPAGDPWMWVRVTGGHCYVRRSSLTLIGKRSAPTVAIRLVGTLTDKSNPRAPSARFLFDRSVVRGEGLDGVQLESPGFDSVIRNSLLVTGDAPVVTVRGSEKAAAGVTRTLRIVTSTLSSQQAALLLTGQSSVSPAPTELILLGALFAAPADARQAALLHLNEWPANAHPAGARSPFKNLSWTAAACAALGFNPVLKVTPDGAANVTDGAGWRKLWKEEAPTTFSPVKWPAESTGGNADLPLKSWSPKTLEALAITFPISGFTPGCPVSDLRAPEFSHNATATANGPERPRPPAVLVPRAQVPIDINKTDLGKFLASKDWADGTVFIVSGSGQRFSSPISVERHKWRIQFRQSEGPTLVVSPRGVPRSGGDNAAFITVRGGQLEIEHGTFTFDAKDSASVAPWFMVVEAGSFSLRNCRIVVPPAAANRNRGIMRWAADNGGNSVVNAGEFLHYGQISDSLLIGNGTLISAALPRRALLLNNSAFIARQHLFEFEVGILQGQDSGALDAQNCTYIAGGTQFSIKSQAPAGSQPQPCRMFHHNSVFATLPRDANSKTGALLMNYAGNVEASHQLQWYEDSCGVASDCKAFFLAGATLPTAAVADQNYEADWIKRWGATHVQRPLRGTDGVVFEKGLGPNAVAVKPENLTLHATAKARTWSETGGPIGVQPQALEPPPAPPKPAPGPKKGPPKTPPKAVF